MTIRLIPTRNCNGMKNCHMHGYTPRCVRVASTWRVRALRVVCACHVRDVRVAFASRLRKCA